MAATGGSPPQTSRPRGVARGAVRAEAREGGGEGGGEDGSEDCGGGEGGGEGSCNGAVAVVSKASRKVQFKGSNHMCPRFKRGTDATMKPAVRFVPQHMVGHVKQTKS